MPKRTSSRTMRWIAGHNLVPTLAIVALIGAAFYSYLAPAPHDAALDAAAGMRARIEGVVVRDPEMRESSVRLTVRPESVNRVTASGKHLVFVSADRFSDPAYGDRIVFSGTLEAPETFETDTGRTFAYPKYLLAHGVTHVMRFPEIEVVSHGEGNPIISSLLSIKHAFIRGIERALPEPESALLEGLLLGEKQSLGERITDAFRRAGVVHIIVLSGYNVSLVIQWVGYALGRLLPRSFAYGATAVFVIAFAIMTGLSETTVRSVIMALLMLAATVLRRPNVALRGLLIAAAVMALWNPYLVLYDLSFQLSVLATLGLILFSDAIASRISLVPDMKYLPLREIAATTLATQAAVLPLLILSVGSLSLVFLPANLLVLPAVPLAMFAGFFASLGSLIVPWLSFPLALIPYGILRYIIEVSVWFGSLPFASFEIPAKTSGYVLASLAILYGIAGFFIWKYRERIFRRNKRRNALS